MMTLASQMASDLNTVFFNTGDFAMAITYTPAGGPAKSIKAIIDYGDAGSMEGMDALNTDAMMDIMADPVNGISMVLVGDKVAVGAESWQVMFARIIDDGPIWRCRISRINR